MPDRNRHDDLDGWLQDRIEPLPPPPGTFEAIQRRARRRKLRKLAMSAGAAVVVIAAAVTVPQVVNLPVVNGARPEAGSTGYGGTTSPASGGESVAGASKTPIPLPSGNPVPPGFQPASATSVSATTTFVIGQAGRPGHCATQFCTSVARTVDGGTTWSGLPAPLAGAPDGAAGVGQIRFLEGINGWAFGPELWSTHDGGEHWRPIATSGRRVIDVETAGDRAFAVEADCTGSGPDFAAACTSFTLYSAPAGTDAWTKVSAATSDLTVPGRAPASAALVLAGAVGYLLAPDGTLYEGGNNAIGWHPVGTTPCVPGAAQPDGQPSQALLAAIRQGDLVLACTGTATVYESAGGGASWQRLAPLPAAGGSATSLAASPAGTLVLGTSAGIDVLPAGGGAWQAASLAGGAPAGGFSFAGMTTSLRGMALPANPADGTVWFTADGGLSWRPSPVR